MVTALLLRLYQIGSYLEPLHKPAKFKKNQTKFFIILTKGLFGCYPAQPA
jgi:hypothetical protein